MTLTLSDVDSIQQPRLNSQAEEILKALQEGPKTNSELRAIAPIYTARISGLRAAGYMIACDWIDREKGLTRYRLEGFKPGDQTRIRTIEQLLKEFPKYGFMVTTPGPNRASWKITIIEAPEASMKQMSFVALSLTRAIAITVSYIEEEQVALRKSA